MPSSLKITSVLVPTLILLLKHLFEKLLLKLMMILSIYLAASFPAAVLLSPVIQNKCACQGNLVVNCNC